MCIANATGTGGDLLGHPIEYIKVDGPEPAICNYSGLRFINRAEALKNPKWKHLVTDEVATTAAGSRGNTSMSYKAWEPTGSY